MCEQATREVAPIQVFLTNLTNIDTRCVLLCLLACLSLFVSISDANMTGASVPPGRKLANALL